VKNEHELRRIRHRLNALLDAAEVVVDLLVIEVAALRIELAEIESEAQAPQFYPPLAISVTPVSA
jgi:hypothetical protein